MMTGMIPAGALPVHCPRMPTGVWGSVSISYLCRLLLWDIQRLMSAFLLLLRLLSHTDQHTCTWSQPSGQDVRTTLLQPPMSWPLTPLPVTQPHQLVLSTQVAFPCSFSTEERRSRRIYYALGCKYIMWPEKHNPLYYNISAKTVQLRNLWSCCLYCFYNSVRTINADWFGLAIIEFKWQYVQQNPYNVLIKLVGCLVFCCFGE